MYEDREILLDTFDAHTDSSVDTADVLARVNAISRTRRRNRWVLQATGASLATVGLVAGGIALPGLLSGSAPRGHTATVRVASQGSPAHTRAQELAAFFDAGYVYGDAQKLAKLWNGTNINRVKAEAGQKLLDGETLPVQPSGTPVPPTDADVEAFFNAGYDYNDAATLAGIWHTTTTYQAKVKAGKKIENGESLPIPPSGRSGAASASTAASTRTKKLVSKKMLIIRKKAAAKQSVPSVATSGTTDGLSPALAAYFNAGYDYTDAQQLASAWHETDLGQVKAQAGQKLLDGDSLPVKPSGQPAPPPNAAVTTFFADGYDYNDAVKLSSMWNVSPYHAKIEGGKKLENGGSLPIQP
jgi:hypothetical protein